MATHPFEGLFTSLAAGYEAALAREEDAAASDLAFSLRQDRTLLQSLVRLGPIALLQGDFVEKPVLVIGRDYLNASLNGEDDRARVQGTLIVPLHRAVIVPGGASEPPVVRDETLVQALRRWARLGKAVTLSTRWGDFRGHLTVVSPKHVEIQAGRRLVVVGLSAVESITCARGGSAGAI
jgi:hypothetical protein